jgi:hypothetical protein
LPPAKPTGHQWQVRCRRRPFPSSPSPLSIRIKAGHHLHPVPFALAHALHPPSSRTCRSPLELRRRDIAGRSKLVASEAPPRLPSFFSFALDTHLCLPCARNPPLVAGPNRALPSSRSTARARCHR